MPHDLNGSHNSAFLPTVNIQYQPCGLFVETIVCIHQTFCIIIIIYNIVKMDSLLSEMILENLHYLCNNTENIDAIIQSEGSSSGESVWRRRKTNCKLYLKPHIILLAMSVAESDLFIMNNSLWIVVRNKK